MNIVQQPGNFIGAHGDIHYSLYDIKTTDPVTYPDYKYVCDIYHNATLLVRLRAQPRVDGYGIFNVGPIVRNLLRAYFSPTAPLTELEDGNFYAGITCKFGNEVSGVLTTNLIVAQPRVFLNSYNPVSTGWITARPRVSNYYGGPAFISYWANDANDVVINIRGYNSSGLQFSYSETASPNFDHSAFYLNLATVPVTSATLYFTVDVDMGASGSDLYRFNVMQECKYTPYTLHFLNRYGGFDSFTFPKVSKQTRDIERKSYMQPAYRISGGVITTQANDVVHEQKINYATRFNDKLALNSDLLTDAEYRWLADLITSPMVYMTEGSRFIPVTIASNNYQFNKVINDGMTNLKVDIEFSNQLNAQFR